MSQKENKLFQMLLSSCEPLLISGCGYGRVCLYEQNCAFHKANISVDISNFTEVLICHSQPRKTTEEETQCKSSLLCFLFMSHIKVFACAHKRQNMLKRGVLRQKLFYCRMQVNVYTLGQKITVGIAARLDFVESSYTVRM